MVMVADLVPRLKRFPRAVNLGEAPQAGRHAWEHPTAPRNSNG